MSKELSAKEWHFKRMTEEGYREAYKKALNEDFQFKSTYSFAEAYANHVATARLEAYKAELVELLKEETKKAREKGSYAVFTPKELLHHLNNDNER